MNLSSLLRTALLGGMFSGLFAATSSAQLISNGSFEGQPGVFLTATTTPNSSTFTGWTALASSGTTEMHIVSTGQPVYPSAVNGSDFLALNGNNLTAGVAQVYQDFSTTAGQSYSVSFSAGRGGNGAGFVGVQADVFNVISGSTAGGALGTVSSSSSSAGFGFYTPSSFNFVATGTTSRLLFSDISTATISVDALIDNVSVSASAIPEPSTYAAIAGASMLGLAVWRRSRKTAATVAPATAA